MHFGLGDWKSQQQLRNLPPQVGFQLPKGNFADVGAVSTAAFYDICLHHAQKIPLQIARRVVK